MVADTYSARLGILEMGTGNQNNSWGTSFNASVTDIIDRALAGQNVRTVTGGTLDLSGSPPPAGPSQAIDLNLTFIGTLTANQTLVLPNNTAFHIITNSTTGAFSFLVQTAAAPNIIEIPANTSKMIFVATNNFVSRMDIADIGMLGHFASSSAPFGWMACNGASLLRTDHPNLFSAIGTIWGAADGTHFTLPNLMDTGRYLRSCIIPAGVGTYQSNQNKTHTHTGSGTTSGFSNDHTHTGSGTSSGVSAFHTHTGSGSTGGMNQNASHSHSISTGSFGGTTGGTAQTGGGTGVPVTPATIAINSTNIDHGHSYSFTTSADSVDHSHTYSFTTSGVSANHTHTYSFTTSTGSADGTEARPETAVVLICIKY